MYLARAASTDARCTGHLQSALLGTPPHETRYSTHNSPIATPNALGVPTSYTSVQTPKLRQNPDLHSPPIPPSPHAKRHLPHRLPHPKSKPLIAILERPVLRQDLHVKHGSHACARHKHYALGKDAAGACVVAACLRGRCQLRCVRIGGGGMGGWGCVPPNGIQAPFRPSVENSAFPLSGASA